MTKIFISYRRQDSKLIVGRIFDRLKDKFGRDGVFMDIDGIPFGVDFRAHLDREVSRATAVLVLIGHGWAEAKDDTGQRRLDNPNDFVRIEIESALKRGIPLGAVLIDGAPIPRAEQLPESLQPLLWRNAAQLDAVRNFDHDMARLIADLGGSAVPPKPAAGSNSLEWSAAEWERVKDSTDIARLKRFAEHAHPYYAEEALDRVQVIEAEAQRQQAEAEARTKAEAEARRLRDEEQARIKAEAERVAREQEEDRRAGVVRILVGTGDGRDEVRLIKPGSGESFKDAPFAPEMVVVPAGKFMMGSPENEPERSGDESPQHEVIIPHPFAVGCYAVTFAEWDAAQADKDWQWITGVKPYQPSDQGWGRGDWPVINVNWNDAQAYVKWLREKTGKQYRLLSEAEWEYVARAGTKTKYWWGDAIARDQANYTGGVSKTVPVKSFKPNLWGLYQVHGNVWESCEDVWHDNYNGGPTDGSAWAIGDSGFRVLRGGSWGNDPLLLRSALRIRNGPDYRNFVVGFRLARTLNP